MYEDSPGLDYIEEIQLPQEAEDRAGILGRTLFLFSVQMLLTVLVGREIVTDDG